MYLLQFFIKDKSNNCQVMFSLKDINGRAAAYFEVCLAGKSIEDIDALMQRTENGRHFASLVRVWQAYAINHANWPQAEIDRQHQVFLDLLVKQAMMPDRKLAVFAAIANGISDLIDLHSTET